MTDPHVARSHVGGFGPSDLSAERFGHPGATSDTAPGVRSCSRVSEAFGSHPVAEAQAWWLAIPTVLVRVGPLVLVRVGTTGAVRMGPLVLAVSADPGER